MSLKSDQLELGFSIRLALQSVILEKCQNYLLLGTRLSWFTCNINLWASLDRFQVDIEIFEDELSQLEDRIFSSHITNSYIIYL